MSMQMNINLQKEIRSMPGNKHCADCGTLNPQWASVSMGSLVCLNCSGQHRSLGVHLSFVRSVTMDSWSDKQIRAMRAGGNDKMNSFLEQHGVPAGLGKTNIRAKYDNDVAEYYRELIEAQRDQSPKPTRAIPTYSAPSSGTSNGSAGAGGGDDFEGLTAEQRYERHKRLEEEARARMRAKFGSSGGLGSGSFGSAGIGSDPNYRPGSAPGGSNNSNSSNSSASDWFASAAKATSQWSSKVSEDVKKAKVADKLKSGWSWFTQSATAVIDKAKANIAKDSAPKLYSRGDSPRSAAPTLYNPNAAREVAHVNTVKPMEGFGSSKTGTPLAHGRTGFGSGTTSSSSSSRMRGFGSSSAAPASSSASSSTAAAAAASNATSSSSGWDDDLFNDDLEDLDGGDVDESKNIADLDDSELLGDIDSVLGEGDQPSPSTTATNNNDNNNNTVGSSRGSPSTPAAGGGGGGDASEQSNAAGDDDDDDFFKEFGM